MVGAKRSKGKARFVIGSALGWSGPMIVGFAVADYYFDGTVKALKFLIEGNLFPDRESDCWVRCLVDS